MEEEEEVIWSKVTKSRDTTAPQQRKLGERNEEEDVFRRGKVSSISTSNSFEGISPMSVEDPFDLLQRLEKKEKKKGIGSIMTKTVVKKKNKARQEEESQRRLANSRDRKIAAQQDFTLEFEDHKDEHEYKKSKKKGQQPQEQKHQQEQQQKKNKTVQEVAKNITRERMKTVIEQSRTLFSSISLQTQEVAMFLEQSYVGTLPWKHDVNKLDEPLSFLHIDVQNDLLDWVKSLDDKSIAELLVFSVFTIFTKDGIEKQVGRHTGWKQLIQVIARASPAVYVDTLPSIRQYFHSNSASTWYNLIWIIQQLNSDSVLRNTTSIILQRGLIVLLSGLDRAIKNLNSNEKNIISQILITHFTRGFEPDISIEPEQFLSLFMLLMDSKNDQKLKLIFDSVKKKQMDNISSKPGFFTTLLVGSVDMPPVSQEEIFRMLTGYCIRKDEQKTISDWANSISESKNMLESSKLYLDYLDQYDISMSEQIHQILVQQLREQSTKNAKYLISHIQGKLNGKERDQHIQDARRRRESAFSTRNFIGNAIHLIISTIVMLLVLACLIWYFFCSNKEQIKHPLAERFCEIITTAVDYTKKRIG